MKSSKGKSQGTYKCRPIRTIPDFSTETVKAKRPWADVIQTLKEHKCQPRVLYPAKLPITTVGKTKIFNNKTKFIQYLFVIPALQRIIDGKLEEATP